ncbi:MAG: hypothetical protein RIC55_11075 [Pirellulaceae bacterium]
MSKHKSPSHAKDHGRGAHGAKKSGQGLHRDWRLWTVVVLMLVGMAVYVLTFDESLSPFRGGGDQQEVPADGE